MRHSFMDNLKELLVHQFNVNSAMLREAAATGYGLPNPERFAHPYPGSTNNIFVVGNPQDNGQPEAVPPVVLPPAAPPKENGWGGWKWLALAVPPAAAAAALTWWYLNRPVEKPAENVIEVLEVSKDGGKTWQTVPTAKSKE